MIRELNKLVNSTRNVLIKQVERSRNEICQLAEAVSSTDNVYTRIRFLGRYGTLCFWPRTGDMECPI